MFERLEKDLYELNATVAKMDAVGLFNTSGTAEREQRYCVDCQDCPLAVRKRDGTRDCPVAGLYVHAVSGTKVEPVWLGGQVVGTTYEDNYARYCFLNDILPESWLSREDQVEQVLRRSESALRSVGMVFDDVVRTWFHLDDILEWYDRFNLVRDRFFKSRGVYDRLVPASTGVGGANSAGAAIVANLHAVHPKRGQVSIRSVPSPLQCSALDDGSSFSRAVELSAPDHTKLYISGTAGIVGEGDSVHGREIDGQVEGAMEVVLAILDSRGMTWADVTRAVGYVKHREDLDAFARYCVRHCMSSAPAVVIHNDVCREGLLFEIELDAVKLKRFAVAGQGAEAKIWRKGSLRTEARPSEVGEVNGAGSGGLTTRATVD